MPEQNVALVSERISTLSATKKIDTRGLLCPYPSFETAKLASEALPGEVIEIISDDKYAAENSIPTVLKLRNFEYAVFEKEGGNFCIKARKL
ncbi:MAG TPA: sulfurtransferase TusA family protein [Nitrososphaerales archaeon]|nr:sulfurtransferase TusA family protein [Nitrososphaerales archaeon]